MVGNECVITPCELMEDLGEVISEGVEGAEYRATHNHPELQETQPVDAE